MSSGIEREIEIPIKSEDYKAWENGGFIHKVAPYLTEDQREFIISGVTQEEWDDMFKEDELYISNLPTKIEEAF